MTHHLLATPCPPGHVPCAAGDHCAPVSRATPVHRAWSRRFPWRVYRRGSPPSPRGRPPWLSTPLYLCPAHTGLVEVDDAAAWAG